MSPTFYVDESCPIQVYRRLVEAGEDAVWAKAGNEGRPDPEWLAEVSARGWVVVTKDARIRYRELEREAVERGGGRLFILEPARMKGEEMGALMVEALPHVRAFLETNPGPFIAKIYKDGSVRRAWPAV